MPRCIDAHTMIQLFPRNAARPTDAKPFDIPCVRLSHHGGHCSFHAMLREYKLTDPVLARIARVIDEADTVQEVNVEPAAPGLDIICTGLRLTSQDDAMAIDKGLLIFDALYAQFAAG